MTDHGCDRSTHQAPMKFENEYRVENAVTYCADKQSDHGKTGGCRPNGLSD